MKKKKKWQIPRSTLRKRMESRAERRGEGQFFTEPEPEYQYFNWENLPASMLQPWREHLFQKTVAAILVVICLGLFGLLNLPLTNRITAAIHHLTVYQTNPAELLRAATPVIQSVRDFNWRRTAEELPTPDPASSPPLAETMAAPVSGVLKSPYGPRLNPESGQMEMHYGIDVAAAAGAPVYAVFSGTVSLVKEHPQYGLTVYLEHPGEKVSIYGHVTELAVAEGDSVSNGQVIAKVAAAVSGESYLHFEFWKNRQPVNPENYLSESE